MSVSGSLDRLFNTNPDFADRVRHAQAYCAAADVGEHWRNQAKARAYAIQGCQNGTRGAGQTASSPPQGEGDQWVSDGQDGKQADWFRKANKC